MKTTPVKGCVDYLPREASLRNAVINKILQVYKQNGFLLIKTPILENLENLTSGDSGDNVKLMFKTLKRRDKLDLSKPNLTEDDVAEEGLRYDLTVPLARFFSNNRNELPSPFKSIQIDESFRAERPQAGRNRQFTQCDIDIWGEKSNIAELEIILTAMQAYNAVGLPGVVCKISSRELLSKLILSAGFENEQINKVCVVVDKIDKIGLDGVKNELVLKEFDEKSINNLINLLTEIRQGGLDLCEKFADVKKEICELKQVIETASKFLPTGYKIEFDISIVRGQGYYTGMVYEMYCPESGFRGAISGGGRYDKMYEKFAGQSVPAVGLGLGLDSVLLVLTKLGKTNDFNEQKVALIYGDDATLEQIITKKNELMKKYNVSIFPYPKNFKEFLRRIKTNGFTHLAKMDKVVIEEI